MTTPTNTPPDLSRWAPSIQGYADWIAADDPAEAREWEHRINQKTAAHVEGAVAEAVAWAYLFPRVDSIRRFPPRASGRKRPDFLCRASDADVVVEVMNLSRDHVTRITGLNDPIVIGAGMKSYQPWDRALKNVLTRKSAQGTSLTSPYVVFVTTLHEEASVLLGRKSHVEMLLHSRSHLRGFIDEHGDPVGEVEVVTDMATAAFTRKNTLVAAPPTRERDARRRIRHLSRRARARRPPPRGDSPTPGGGSVGNAALLLATVASGAGSGDRVDRRLGVVSRAIASRLPRSCRLPPTPCRWEGAGPGGYGPPS